MRGETPGQAEQAGQAGQAGQGMQVVQLDTLPIYQSHKRVQGARILHAASMRSTESWEDLHWVDVELPGGARRRVMIESAFAAKLHSLLEGSIDKGYLVRYEDGYLSWSPTQAFEQGNRRVSDFTGD